MTSGGAQAQPAMGTTVDAPETWTPAKANRTPVGGPAPDRDWRPAGAGDVRAQRATCPGSNYGVLPSYPMERHQVSDRFEILINLDNGNAVLAYRELTVKGTGLNLAVDRFYNTFDGYSPGTEWLMSYDAIGLEVWDGGVILHGPNGYCEWFNENTDGTFAPAPKLDAKLTRTPDGGYVVSFDGSDERWLFTASGWLVSQTDRNGNTITNRYRPDGKLASVTDTQNRVTRFDYDTQGRPASITDPSGLTVGHYGYDAWGMLQEITDRDGEKIRIEYSPTDSDEVTGVVDPNGGKYLLEHDPSTDRLVKLTKPTPDGTGATTTYSYDSANRATTVTDANNHASRHEFDDEGRQVKATDALGHEQSQTWTAASDVNTTTNGLQHSTTYRYDSLNNLIGTELPTGAKSVVGYTSSAHPHLPTQVTDPSGNQHTREYDTRGNLTKVRSTGLNADIETYTYHSLGLVATRKDGKGAITSYEYDNDGNLTKVVPPTPAGATTYTYDSLSRVTSVTDGNGVRIEYGYDRLDRVVSITHGTTVVQANTYDANGNLTRTQVPGTTRVLDYDPRNQLTKVTRGTEQVSYTYDKVGNLKTLTTSSGTATYHYDAADRLIELVDAGNVATTFGYDDADRRTRTTFPGGAAQITRYDNSGRPTSVEVAKSLLLTQLVSYRYTKPDGTDTDKIQSKTVKRTTTTDYTYDALGRLTKAGTGTYGLDNAGNLLNGEGRTYTVNAADQYTKINDTNVTFDGAGNYKSTTNPESDFTYSPTNQLLTGNLGTNRVLELTYHTSDQTQPGTITETPTGVSQVTHVFTHTALGVTETVDNGQRTGYTRDTDGLLIGLKTPAGARHGAVTDHQGSILALVDSSGNLAAEYTYAPYGSVTATGSAATSNPFRYLGAYQLQRGHHLLGYRVYDSTLARFRSPDPTGQEPNPYNYAQGDPINNSDPTGSISAPSQAATVGGFLGTGLATAMVASCPATAGAGCFAAGVVMGGLLGGAGGALGSRLAGGSAQDVNNDGSAGITGGVLGGGARFAKALKGLWSR
ncbi:RHS repeat-associated core domain-containing protein [Actinosynnema sp. NPDC059797]